MTISKDLSELLETYQRPPAQQPMIRATVSLAAALADLGVDRRGLHFTISSRAMDDLMSSSLVRHSPWNGRDEDCMPGARRMTWLGMHFSERPTP